MGATEIFKSTILVLLFYSFSITLVAYSIPADAKPYITGYSDFTNEINLEGVAETVQSSLDSQTNIPVIELGALVFYSGNILIDLILNFLFGIPEMFTGLINGIMTIINLNPFIAQQIQIISGVIFTVFYFIAVINLLIGIRSGRLIEG